MLFIIRTLALNAYVRQFRSYVLSVESLVLDSLKPILIFLESAVQGILADALKCLGDNKKVVREAVTKMLDSWVLLLQLDKMVSLTFINSDIIL